MLKQFVPTDELELQPFPNGRGPFRGRISIRVNDSELPVAPSFMIEAGKDPQHESLVEDSCVVRVTTMHPFIGYARWFRDPILAENLASILDAVGYLREEQMLSLGFIEDRRDVHDN